MYEYIISLYILNNNYMSFWLEYELVSLIIMGSYCFVLKGSVKRKKKAANEYECQWLAIAIAFLITAMQYIFQERTV